jgi:GR25 family glycosyltransferase involved in LPS biosynthesis
MPLISVHIINMDGEEQRASAIAAQFPQDGRFVVYRSRGVPGSILPHVAADVLTRAPGYHAVGLGTLGVFLAHVAAWETIAAGSFESALILEDDAIVFYLDIFNSDTFPNDWELIFCNAMMDPEPIDDNKTFDRIVYVPIDFSLRALHARDSKAVGGYGYFIRRHAAQKLLDTVRKDWFFGHVDWRILRYCVTPELLEKIIPNTNIADIIRGAHRQPFAWGVLTAYAASPALVRHAAGALRRSSEDERARMATKVEQDQTGV